MGVREEQKEKRRQEILEVGLDLFIRKGYAATKISDIAEAAGMSKGLLFHYFESKEALYNALIEFGLWGTQMAAQTPFNSPVEFFQSAAGMILEAVKSNPFSAKIFVLMNQAQYNDALTEEMRAQISKNDTVEQSAQLISLGQADGSIRQGDPLALVMAFWLAIQSTAEAVARDPNMPCPKAEWFVDIIKNKQGV